jgi:hypothetical protein
MKLTGENRQLGEKPVPVPLCPPQISHGLDLGSNPGLRGERPATNRLSHGTAWWSPTYTVFSWAQHHTVGLSDSYKLNTGPLRRLATGRSGGSNPVGGKFFGTRPDQPWGPLNLLYNGYRLSFPGVKRPGRGVNHPPSSSAEVKGRVELYLCPPLCLYGRL